MRQSYTDFDVLVIDNASTDNTLAVLKTYPVKVITDPKKKLSYLFNLAWRSTKGNYIAYLADDVELHHDWLKSAIQTFSISDKIVCVGGPIISTHKQGMHLLYEKANSSKLLIFISKIYEDVIMEGRLFEPGALAQSGAYSMGASLESSLRYKSPISIDLLTTSAMVVERKILNKLGGFDENFYFNHADGDLFIRMKQAGYKLIFNPKVIAWHHVRPGLSRNVYFVARDTGYFIAKDIRPDTLRGCLGFVLNIVYLNAYWIYQALETGDTKNLYGIQAFLIGATDYLKNR